MTDGWFLPKHEQDQLVELLDQIPGLVDDLTIAITRQDRIGHSGPRVRSGSDEQPLPVNLNASDAADLLHDTLAAWVRHTTEHRALTYQGRDDTMSLARWLKRWIVALALSPGADEAIGEIRHAIRNARRACDRPREKHHDVDDIAVYEAGSTLLTATEIERIAPTLGHPRLTMRRILRLKDAEKLEPAMTTGDGTDLYRIADAITAHLTHPARKRKAA